MVSELVSGLSSPSSDPSRGHCVEFLGFTFTLGFTFLGFTLTLLLHCLSPHKCINGYRQT